MDITHSLIKAIKAAVKAAKAYTDQKTAGISGGIEYKGSVSYYSDLPANPAVNDAYTVKYAGTSGSVADGTEYVWGYDTDQQAYAWIDWSKDSYTKAETNSLLAGKQNTIDNNHKLAGSLSVLTGYSIASSASALSADDTVNQAFGKIEKGLNDVTAVVGDINAALEEVL